MTNETEFERSTLHTKSMIRWFQSRHPTTTKETYTFLPDQTHYVKTLIELFREFDKDNSNSLDKQELFNLLRKYGIQLTQEELNSFFSLVDKNHDRSLTLDEFKLCVSDQAANKHFTNMMEKIRLRSNVQNHTADNVVEPLLTFKKVLNQITYLEQRAETIDNLYNNKALMSTRVMYLKKLLELNNKVEVQLQYKPKIKNTTIPIYSRASLDIKKEITQIVNQAKENGIEAAQAEIINLNHEALSERPKSLNLQAQLRMSQSQGMKFHRVDNDSRRMFMHPPKLKETPLVESKINELNSRLNEQLKFRKIRPKNYLISKNFELIDKQIFQNPGMKVQLAVVKFFQMQNNPDYYVKLDQYQQQVSGLNQKVKINVDKYFQILEKESITDLHRQDNQDRMSLKRKSVRERFSLDSQSQQITPSIIRQNKIPQLSKFKIQKKSDDSYFIQKTFELKPKQRLNKQENSDSTISRDLLNQLRDHMQSSASFRQIESSIPCRKIK